MNGRTRTGPSLWLLIPAVLPILLLSVIPLLQGMYLGFTDYRLGPGQPEFNGLDNYRYMLTDYKFWSSFRTGALWAVSVTGGEIILGLGLALLLNARLPLQGLARVLILIPWAMPPVVKGLVWRMVYHPTVGLLNRTLLDLGILETPINWLGDYTWTLPAAIVVGIWAGLPLAAVMLLAALQTVPQELKEAAALDGASSWGQFWYVVLPLLVPVIVALSTIELIWNFNSFGLVYVLTEGGPGDTTRLPMLYAYEEGFRYGNLGYAAALGNVMVFAMLLLIFFYVRRSSREVA